MPGTSRPCRWRGSAVALAIEDLRLIMAEVVDALPRPERAVVTALYWEQLSSREAAARIGVSHATVLRLRDRAFERIKELTDERED